MAINVSFNYIVTCTKHLMTTIKELVLVLCICNCWLNIWCNWSWQLQNGWWLFGCAPPAVQKWPQHERFWLVRKMNDAGHTKISEVCCLTNVRLGEWMAMGAHKKVKDLVSISWGVFIRLGQVGLQPEKPRLYPRARIQFRRAHFGVFLTARTVEMLIFCDKQTNWHLPIKYKRRCSKNIANVGPQMTSFRPKASPTQGLNWSQNVTNVGP